MRSALLALLAPAALLLLAASSPAARSSDVQEQAPGEDIFRTVCVGCHTVSPPPDSAPPMAHVSRRLRMELGTLEAFTEHVRSYVAAPAAERSRLPAMAVERFGVMAPLPLGDSILGEVASYIWTLADSAEMGRMGRGGRGAGRGAGMDAGMGRGMRHRHGAPAPDSAGRGCPGCPGAR